MKYNDQLITQIIKNIKEKHYLHRKNIGEFGETIRRKPQKLFDIFLNNKIRNHTNSVKTTFKIFNI